MLTFVTPSVASTPATIPASSVAPQTSSWSSATSPLPAPQRELRQLVLPGAPRDVLDVPAVAEDHLRHPVEHAGLVARHHQQADKSPFCHGRRLVAPHYSA